MEAKIEVEEVLEGLTGNFAHGTLPDIGKDGVQKFPKKSGANTCSPICAKQQTGD
jgi:hypothetical protein